MPRKPRKSKILKQTISPALRAYLLTGEMGQADAEVFLLSGHPDRLRAVWDIFKSEIIFDWIKKNPGSRPWAWWEISAPKEAVAGWDHERFNSAQRQRVGGIGNPKHEVTVSWGGFDRGIPTAWVSKFEEDYYNGRARDVYGNIISTKYQEGDFTGVAFDPEDPPTYESETSYLSRHGLLTDAEKKYLQGHPELLEPETVDFEE